MTDAASDNASTEPAKGCTLFGILVLIAVIAALVFALHTIFLPRPRVLP